MDNKNVRPQLNNRAELTRLVRDLLNSRISDFGKPLASFVIDTADLTEELFHSRYRPGYSAVYPEAAESTELAWYTALLSLLQQYTGLTFEEIMAHSHIEIAGSVYLLNPDARSPLDQRIPRYINQLAQGTDVVKITALTRVLAAILTLTEDLRFRNISHERLYELSWLLKEFKIFTGWSKKVSDTWMQCADVVNSWIIQGLLKRNLPRPSCYFALDSSIRVNNLRQLFEN